MRRRIPGKAGGGEVVTGQAGRSPGHRGDAGRALLVRKLQALRRAGPGEATAAGTAGLGSPA